jgi:phosphoesterase RecJ-like protein
MSIIRDTSYPAAGLIVYDLLQYLNANITEPIATALYTAILTDTGQFGFSGTDSRCLKVASFLVDKGASPSKISRQIYWNYPLQYIMNMAQPLKI